MSTAELVGPEAAGGEVSTQAAVIQLRNGLLRGRGPGASRSEFLENTRARIAVGGVPVPALREHVALDAASARGDVDALTLAVTRQRGRLAADLDVLLPRLRPRALRSGVAGSLRRPAARRRLRMAAALFAVLLVARWLGRHRPLHRDSR